MIRRPPRSTQSRSSAASDVYKRQDEDRRPVRAVVGQHEEIRAGLAGGVRALSLIHISEPTRLGMISYAVVGLKKKKDRQEEGEDQRATAQHVPAADDGDPDG